MHRSIVFKPKQGREMVLLITVSSCEFNLPHLPHSYKLFMPTPCFVHQKLAKASVFIEGTLVPFFRTQ
jgi:hypothetical protein